MSEIFMLVVILVFFWLGARTTWRIFNWFLSLETAAKTSAFAYYTRRLFFSLLVGFFSALLGHEMIANVIEDQASLALSRESSGASKKSSPGSLNIPVPLADMPAPRGQTTGQVR